MGGDGECDEGDERGGERAVEEDDGVDVDDGVDRGCSTLGVSGISEFGEREKRAVMASAKASMGSRTGPWGVRLVGDMSVDDGDDGDNGNNDGDNDG